MLSTSSRPLGAFAAMFVGLLLQIFFGITFASPFPIPQAPQIGTDALSGLGSAFWLNDIVEAFAEKGVILNLDDLTGDGGYDKMMNDPNAADITRENVVDMMTEPTDPTQFPKLVQALATDPVLDAVDKSATLVIDLTEPAGRSPDAEAILAEIPGSTDNRKVFKTKARAVLSRILKVVALLGELQMMPPEDKQKTARAAAHMAADQQKAAIAEKTNNVVMSGAETEAGSNNAAWNKILAIFKLPNPFKTMKTALNQVEAVKNDPALKLLRKGVTAIATALRIMPDGTVQNQDGQTVSADTLDPSKPQSSNPTQNPNTPTDPTKPTGPNPPTEPVDPNAPTQPEGNPNDPTNPNEPTDPGNNVDPTNPDDPTNPKPKTQPKGPTRPPRA